MDFDGHGRHGGHGDIGPKCSLNMLWNTQIIDTCIVFESWHISSNTSFFFSCLIIVAMGIFYEYLREFQKKYDLHLAKSLVSKGKGRIRVASSGENSPVREYDESEISAVPRAMRVSATGTRVPMVPRIVRAISYGATIFLSFFLMLVFMTYNAYLILAVVLGAAIGHYIFGSTINTETLLSDGPKSMACH